MTITLEVGLTQTQKSELAIKLLNDFISTLKIIGFEDDQIQIILASYNGDDNITEDRTHITDIDDDRFDEAEESSDKSWKIEKEAEKKDFAVNLRRYQKRISAAQSNADSNMSRDDLSRLLAAIDYLDEAYEWYANECGRMHVEFSPSRDRWILEATDEMLDNEDDVIFFDETRAFQDASLYQVERFVAKSSMDETQEFVDVIEGKMKRSRFQFPDRVISSLVEARSNCANYGKFLSFFASLESNLEISRSELVANIQNNVSRDIPEYIILEWIEKLKDKGKIRAFKKGNRWQIQII